MERNEKGQFLPGNKEGHRFTRNRDATEAGAKGNIVREELQKKDEEGNIIYKYNGKE